MPLGKYGVQLSRYHAYEPASTLAAHTRPVKEGESFVSIAFEEMIAPGRLGTANQALLAKRDDPNVLFDRTDVPDVEPDEVAIPEFLPRYFEVEVNYGHNERNLVLEGAYTRLRYRLLRNGKPIKNTKYELKISNQEGKDPEVMPRRARTKGPAVKEIPLPTGPKIWPPGPKEIVSAKVDIPINGDPEPCVTDAEGYFDHDIFANAKVGKLTIKSNLTETVDLTFGALYPLKLVDTKNKPLLYVLAAKQRLTQLGYFDGEMDGEVTEEFDGVRI